MGNLEVQWEMNIEVSLLVSEQDCDESGCFMLFRSLDYCFLWWYGGMWDGRTWVWKGIRLLAAMCCIVT
jgi:hypothetical protein